MTDNTVVTLYAEYNAHVRNQLTKYSTPTVDRIIALQTRGELASSKITKHLESSASLHRMISDRYDC